MGEKGHVEEPIWKTPKKRASEDQSIVDEEVECDDKTSAENEEARHRVQRKTDGYPQKGFRPFARHENEEVVCRTGLG